MNIWSVPYSTHPILNTTFHKKAADFHGTFSGHKFPMHFFPSMKLSWNHPPLDGAFAGGYVDAFVGGYVDEFVGGMLMHL